MKCFPWTTRSLSVEAQSMSPVETRSMSSVEAQGSFPSGRQYISSFELQDKSAAESQNRLSADTEAAAAAVAILIFSLKQYEAQYAPPVQAQSMFPVGTRLTSSGETQYAFPVQIEDVFLDMCLIF